MRMNYYEILGVSPTATVTEIRKAYKTKALKCHPDKTASFSEAAKKFADAEFREINDAHTTLTDEQLRKTYDGRGDQQSTLACAGTRIYTDEKAGLTAKIHFKLYMGNGGFTGAEGFVEKDTLLLFLKKFSTDVDYLHNMAEKNQKYKKVAHKISELYYTLSDNMSVLTNTDPSSASVLEALNKCKQSILKAEEDGEFALHRGFVRTTPGILHVYMAVQLLFKFMDFLSKKLYKLIIADDNTPVFEKGLKVGFFKEPNTATVNKITQLKNNIDWYIDNVNREERTNAKFKPKRSSPD